MHPLISFGRSRRSARAHVRGTAIVAALVVVVLVGTLSMVYVQMSLSKNKEQRGSVDAKRAFYMAEAGLAEGFNGLCMGKSGNVGSEVTPAEFGKGLFWTTATELGEGRVRLQSTGLCGAGRATLALTVERKADNVGALGFFGDQTLVVGAGALIDSYDSRAGAYAGQALLAPVGSLLATGARVGGNADVTVNGGTLLRPTKVYGNVTPGPMGTVFQSGITTITGSMAPSTTSMPLPAVDVPSVIPERDLDVQANTVMVVPTGIHGMSQLVVRTAGTLTIQGPGIYVVERLTVETGASFKIDSTNGPVKLYITDGMDLASGSRFGTVTNDPVQVSIQVAGTGGVNIGSTGDFYGSIYAPVTSVLIPSTLTVFGAVAAQELRIAAQGKFHFDRALCGSTSDALGTPSALGWHIVELPNVAAVNLRYDAVTEVVRRGIVPKIAAAAHFDLGELVQ